MKRLLGALILLALVAAALYTSRSNNVVPLGPIEGNLLAVRAANDAEMPSQLIHYTGMDVSFNPEAHVPNWVAWELTRDETDGEEPRHNRFETDSDVRGCATVDDYRNSGYDRGHMAPAADMKWDSRAMHESFLLTNICPQDHRLNAGTWKKLEEKCRLWAQADSAIYIVCGPVLTDPVDEYIGASSVVVPKRFFKVILSPYANPPRGIGFIMPNGTVEGGMQKAACSIDEVEAITGLDFFAALPDSIEAAVESQSDFHKWSRIRPDQK